MSNIYSKLRRTTINEGDHFKLRRLISEDESDPHFYDIERGALKLSNLCYRDIEKGNDKSIYCGLLQLSQNITQSFRKRLDRDLSDIYDFLRKELVVDNRRKFHGLITKILEHDNASNSINLVANYVRNTESVDEIRRTIDIFRKKKVSEEDLEMFLTKAKFSEYTKYEMSFIGDHFKRNATFLRLKYKTESDTRDIINRIYGILDGKTKVSTVVDELYSAIRSNYNPEEMIKGDLICVKGLLDNKGKTIIPNGSIVEVKKLDYQADSYLSEFFSIYKQKDLPEIVYSDEFLSVYNKIMDGLFVSMETNGKDILRDIKRNFSGIIYDNNHFISSDDITFYWSNKGRSKCSQHRLSIRYKINKNNLTGFIFDKKKGYLEPTKLTINMKEDFVFCPFSR